MEEIELRDLETMFAQVEDPRVERTKLHRLRDIIILAICGVMCGAEGWVEIEEFGKAASFFEWVQGISKTVKGVIAVDGKTLRRSHDHSAGKKALHLGE